MSRVVITGIGVNSPIGCELEECFEHIEKGTKALGNLQNVSTETFPTNFAGEVKEKGKIVITPPDTDRKALFMDRSIHDLIQKEDFRKRYDASDIVMNIGTGIDYFDLASYINSGHYKSANWPANCQPSFKAAKNLTEKYHFNGGCNVNVSACVASSQAIGLSFRMLKKMKNKAILTGGFDSMLSHLHYMGFYKLGALSSFQGKAEEACKPFDKNRCGLVIGEGGIALLMENEEHAIKENILAEVAGYSTTFDAFTITDPEPNGTSLAKAALEAISEAGITPDDIDCAHLHETGTIKNAIAESKALETVFGARAKKIPVYSMKGQIGHLIGGCGAMEMMGVIFSLKYQKVPVTVNFETADPEVPVNAIKGKPLSVKIKYVLKLNAAFGGQNTALVLKKYE